MEMGKNVNIDISKVEYVGMNSTLPRPLGQSSVIFLSVDNDMRLTKRNLCLTDRKTFTDRTNWIQPFQEH